MGNMAVLVDRKCTLCFLYILSNLREEDCQIQIPNHLFGTLAKVL